MVCVLDVGTEFHHGTVPPLSQDLLVVAGWHVGRVRVPT